MLHEIKLSENILNDFLMGEIGSNNNPLIIHHTNTIKKGDVINFTLQNHTCRISSHLIVDKVFLTKNTLDNRYKTYHISLRNHDTN